MEDTRLLTEDNFADDNISPESYLRLFLVKIADFYKLFPNFTKLL